MICLTNLPPWSPWLIYLRELFDKFTSIISLRSLPPWSPWQIYLHDLFDKFTSMISLTNLPPLSPWQIYLYDFLDKFISMIFLTNLPQWSPCQTYLHEFLDKFTSMISLTNLPPWSSWQIYLHDILDKFTSMMSLTNLPPWSPWQIYLHDLLDLLLALPLGPAKFPLHRLDVICSLFGGEIIVLQEKKKHWSLQCTHCTLHTAHYTLHIAYCTMHTENCSLHTAHFSLYSAHYKLDTTHCPLCTAKLLPAGDSWTIFPFHLWQVWSFPFPIPPSWRKRGNVHPYQGNKDVPGFVHCPCHPGQETREICHLVLWLLTASWMSGSPGAKSNVTKYLQSTFSSPPPFPPYNLIFFLLK